MPVRGARPKLRTGAPDRSVYARSDRVSRRSDGATVAGAPRLLRRDVVTLGASLFTIGIGAILHFAVTATIAGIDIQVVGTILMVIGVIGFALSIWLLVASRRRGPAPPPPPSSTYY